MALPPPRPGPDWQVGDGSWQFPRHHPSSRSLSSCPAVLTHLSSPPCALVCCFSYACDTLCRGERLSRGSSETSAVCLRHHWSLGWDASWSLAGLNCSGNNPGRHRHHSVEVNELFSSGGDKARGFKNRPSSLNSYRAKRNKTKHSLDAQRTIHTQWQHLAVDEVCFKQIENFKGVASCVEYVGVNRDQRFLEHWIQPAFFLGFV